MAIKIQTQKPEIPVEIGNLKFSFNVSDESVKEFHKEADEVRKELESIVVSDDDEKALEQAKNALKRGFDIMLGEGAFDKIYKLSPSTMICMRYFHLIAEGIKEELENMGYSESQQEKAKKYIQSKKK